MVKIDSEKTQMDIQGLFLSERKHNQKRTKENQEGTLAHVSINRYVVSLVEAVGFLVLKF